MKNYKFYIAIVAGVLVFSYFNKEKTSVYSPREKHTIRYAADWNGASEYYTKIRANINTGKVELEDVLKAREAVRQFSLKKSGSLNLQWKERGPDNIGGRTRAILVDKNNSDHVFAGSVSGGLFVSDDGGGTWRPVNDQFENLIVASLAQAPNGDIWMGTGSDFDYSANVQGILFPGHGLYKSTDGGVTFVHVKERVAPYIIFQGGGGSGASATATISGGVVTSITLVSGGTNYSSNPSIQINNGGGGGSGATATATVSGGVVTNVTLTNGGSGYTGVVNNVTDDWCTINKIAVHPSNSNQIFVATHKGLRVSSDGGATWENPMFTNIASCTGQINSVAEDVDITPDGRLFVSKEGTIYYSDNPLVCSSYVKVTDVPTEARTEIAVAPSNSNYVYACTVNSGGHFTGVYQSTSKGADGTWIKILSPIGTYFTPMTNDGLGYGQGVYDLAFAVAPDDENEIFIGGVELWKHDNGTLTRIATEGDFGIGAFYVHADKHIFTFDPNDSQIMYVGCDGGVFKSFDQGNTFFAANRGYNVTQFYGIAYSNNGEVLGGSQDNGSILITGINPNSDKEGEDQTGGDGFDCEISQLTNARFTTIYQSVVSRSSASGGSYALMSGDFVKPNSPFYTVIRLWETLNDPTSQDSVTFKVDTTKQIVGTGNGTKKTFATTLTPVQSSAKIVIGSLRIQAGSVNFNDFANTSNPTSPFTSGGNTATIDYTTGTLTVTFANPPSTNLSVWAYYTTHYDAGSVLILNSNTEPNTISYALTSDMDYGDSVVIQDPVQSLMALSVLGSDGGVVITRDALDFSVDPEWIEMNVGTPSCIEFSKDGNHMFVGIAGSGVWRISGLNKVYSQSDYDSLLAAGTVTKYKIYNTGYFVTGIAVDDNNPQNVVVTVGNYGHTDYIYRSSNAVSTTNQSSFSDATGDLPFMPVYDAEFIRNTSSKVVIGTEFGVYATTDIFANPVSWTDENSGTFPHTPTFDVRQQKFWPSYNYEKLYIGTHGRGIWESSSFETGIYEPEKISSKTKFISDLTVYPNPMHKEGFVAFNAKSASQADVTVYDVFGKTIKSMKKLSVSSGQNRIKIDAENIPAGSYFITVEAENISSVAKFVVLK